MLQGNFFNITSFRKQENNVLATLELNPVHQIYEGHFPGTPVVPGVCMMQMVKEVLEDVIENDTRIIHAAHMKFLTVIDPRLTKQIQLDLTYNFRGNREIELVASLFNEGVVYFKIKVLLKSI